MWCTSDSSDEADLLPLCWGPVPMLACPLLALWAVDRSQDGSLTGLHLFSPIRNKLWRTVYSIYALVDVGSDHMGQLLFPVYISEPWLPMSLSLVHPISFLGLLLIDADHCRPGTRHRSGSIGDTLTLLLSRHSSALVKLSQILTFTSFSCF